MNLAYRWYAYKILYVIIFFMLMIVFGIIFYVVITS